MESRNRTRPRTSARSLLVAVLWGIVVAGCAEDAAPAAGDAIPTESFVGAMVALRTSPMMGSSGFLPSGEPERILGELGLTPDDLRRFVQVHGGNVRMMTDVWTEVENRVAEARGEVTAPGS